MSLTRVTFVYNGGPQVFPTNFALGILETDHVYVAIDGNVDGAGNQIFSNFNYDIATGDVTITDSLTVGDTGVIFRQVPIDLLITDFEQGDDVTRRNLTRASKQVIMAVQEVKDQSVVDNQRIDAFLDEVVDSVEELTQTAVNAASDAGAARDAAEGFSNDAETSAQLAATALASADGLRTYLEVKQRKEGELFFGFDNGSTDTQIFANAQNIPNGFAYALVNGQEKYFVLARIGSNQCRIVEFNAGSSAHVAFSEPLNLSGQDLSVNVEGSAVTLYTMPSSSKGVAVINWRGSATDNSDVTEYQLFGATTSGHRFERWRNATVGVYGDKLCLLANVTRQNIDETGHNLFVYSLAEVLAAGNSLDVDPIHGPVPIRIGLNDGQQVLQGLAPGPNCIAVQRGFVNPFQRKLVQIIDYQGNILREIEYSASLADYSTADLGQSSSLGSIISIEPEGCAFDNSGRLLLLCQEDWRTTGDVVSWEGFNFTPRRASVTVNPSNGDDWVRTTATASGEWSAGTYTWGANYTRRSKVVHSIGKPLGDGQDKPLSSPVWLDNDNSTIKAGRNASDVSFPSGDALTFSEWESQSGRYRRVMQFINRFAMRLFDAREGADNSKQSTISVDMSGGREILQLRARSTIGNGAGINLYGNDDSLRPGQVWIIGQAHVTFPGPFADDTDAASNGVAVGEAYRVIGGSVVWRRA